MTTQERTTAVSTWRLDPVHSVIEFAVKHLIISTVKGVFRDLEGTIHIDEQDPTRSSVEAIIRTASVDTGVDMRDNDLRSENFFDAEKFPTMAFRSTGVEKVDDEHWRVHGDLAIRGVIRPVVLETDYEGRVTAPPAFGGQERIGFTATTALNRRDFGLTYNAVLETGGIAVGDNVKITLHIEAIKEASPIHSSRDVGGADAGGVAGPPRPRDRRPPRSGGRIQQPA